MQRTLSLAKSTQSRIIITRNFSSLVAEVGKERKQKQQYNNNLLKATKNKNKHHSNAEELIAKSKIIKVQGSVAMCDGVGRRKKNNNN